MKNSLKSKIRYWFLFLRLAHKIRDPHITKNLKGSADRYASWGDYQTESFETWWKRHAGLFRDVSTVRALTAGESVLGTDFVVSVPYTMSPTAVGKVVASMYRKAQENRTTERVPKSGKTKKIYSGQFTLSAPEYQVAQFAYYYLFSKNVYVPSVNAGGRRTNRDLLDKAKVVFGKLKRKSTKVRKVPFTDKDLSADADSKQIRRYVHYADKLLTNVSLGIFPGEYELTPKKTLVQLKLEFAEKRSKSQVKRKYRRGAKTKGEDGFRKYSAKDDPLNPVSHRKKRKDAGVKRKKTSN